MHSHPNGNWMMPHPAGKINYYNGSHLAGATAAFLFMCVLLLLV
jgi:hypothetical protein